MTEKFNDKQPDILKGYNMLLYFAGTMITFDPSKECIHDFWSEGILKGLPVSSHNPRFIKAAAQLHQSVDDQSSNIVMMKEDYLSLFSGRNNPLAPPLESVYRNNNQSGFNKLTYEVREFYNSYGWESKFKGSIPDDHLGVELLFLTLMIEKYLEFDDEICNSEMRNEIRRFIDQHLISWIPAWNENIQERAITISYKGISSLILACVEDIYNIMSQTDKNFN
jgi:TorA maturation chaperone TorD